MNTLNKHEDFHNTFGQPVLDKGEVIPEDRRKLRLNLAFEELTELAEAFGCLKYFKSLCTQLLHEPYNESTDVYNETEILDALVDIEVINNGTVLETGFKDCFYNAYKQTHDNNMSKSHSTLEELQESHLFHQSKGLIGLTYKEINGRFVLYNDKGKVIKPVNYIPNDLSNFIKKPIMSERDILNKKYDDNINQIKSLKEENTKLYKELCLLSDDKQWYTEETKTIGSGKKKREVLRGYINWNQDFKDGDTNNFITVTRKMVVIEDGKWV